MAGGAQFGPGWNNLKFRLNPRLLMPRLQKELGKATKYGAALGEKVIKGEIKVGVAPANAKLTILLKGSRGTLRDMGDLRKAVTHEVPKWNHGMAGIFRSSPMRRGRSLLNLAWTLHEGATIPVTQKMRMMFDMLAFATDPKETRPLPGLHGRAAEIYAALGRRGQIFPLRRNTRFIRIPGRPFVALASKRPSFRVLALNRYKQAILKALDPKGAKMAAGTP